MILNIDDTTLIDIDRISFINTDNRMVVVDGQGIHLRNEEESFNAILKAFKWARKSQMYNKDIGLMK